MQHAGKFPLPAAFFILPFLEPNCNRLVALFHVILQSGPQKMRVSPLEKHPHSE